MHRRARRSAQTLGGMTVLAGVVGGVAGFVLVGGVLLRCRAQSQRRWLRVEGRILSSTLSLGRSWNSRVSYEYAHGGRKFRSERIRSLEIVLGWRAPAANDVERYPPGRTVTVYVDPRDPHFSVLEPGGHWWFLPLVFSLSALLGYVALSLR
jgi:hypothetical protein